jgi:hypothetical protein
VTTRSGIVDVAFIVDMIGLYAVGWQILMSL